jgi:hypothetical protein
LVFQCEAQPGGKGSVPEETPKEDEPCNPGVHCCDGKEEDDEPCDPDVHYCDGKEENGGEAQPEGKGSVPEETPKEDELCNPGVHCCDGKEEDDEPCDPDVHYCDGKEENGGEAQPEGKGSVPEEPPKEDESCNLDVYRTPSKRDPSNVFCCRTPG